MRQRTLLIALAVVALIATAGIVVVLQPNEAAAQRQQQGFTVSFAAAETEFEDEAERADRLRDWARIGLAAHLGMDTNALRDAFFDALPIRDNGFTDLARQPTGPGRALANGNTPHLLIPRDDVNDKRTAGLLLDQHRTDTGDDPEQVRVHRYEIRDHTIEITDEDTKNTNDFRAQNGYVTGNISNTGELGGFLATAKHLSTLVQHRIGGTDDPWLAFGPDGPVVADALDQGMTGTVREVAAEKPRTEKPQAVPADVRGYRDAEWARVDAPLRIGTSSSLNIVITLPSAAPNAGASPLPPAGPAARIVLICPEDDDANGCGD